MIGLDIVNALHRNGIIIERARREGRSLSYEERSIIVSGRNKASEQGITRKYLNALEMEGETDRGLVFEPVRVKAVFAYYDAPYEDIPASASYLIVESNHPALPQFGNVSADTLTRVAVKVPKAPTYQQWVKNGRKCYRGG